MNVLPARTEAVAALPKAIQRTRAPVHATLAFSTSGRRTFLARQYTPHPFHITRPFYLSGDPEGMATLYLQSSSGGLYGDDCLDLTIATGEGAAAHVTSQASTVVPASHGGRARLAVHLELGPDSTLEYMPDPLILFDGADAETTLDVTIAPGARAIVADAIVLHRPGGGPPASGRWSNCITVAAAGEESPRLVERQRLDLRDRLPFEAAPGEQAGASPCYGALYCISPDTDAAAATMAASLLALGEAASRRALYWGVSPLPRKGIVGARFLCRDGAVLSAALEAAWIGARRAISGGLPTPRRK